MLRTITSVTMTLGPLDCNLPAGHCKVHATTDQGRVQDLEGTLEVATSQRMLGGKVCLRSPAMAYLLRSVSRAVAACNQVTESVNDPPNMQPSLRRLRNPASGGLVSMCVCGSKMTAPGGSCQQLSRVISIGLHTDLRLCKAHMGLYTSQSCPLLQAAQP